MDLKNRIMIGRNSKTGELIMLIKNLTEEEKQQLIASKSIIEKLAKVKIKL